MALPDDLSDVTDPRVAAVVPQWLELLAEFVAVPGVGVRRAGSSLNMLLPERLLLTLHTQDDGRWAVRVQSLLAVPELGDAGRPFSLVGVIQLPIHAGCGDPRAAAAVLRRLLDVDSALDALEPGSDDRLLRAWRHLRDTAAP